jgi:hypothetical protein
MTVPAGFFHLCRIRRFVGLVAIASLLAQTLVAGIFSAFAAKAPAEGLGVICHHGASGDDPADIPDSGKGQQGCCVYCAAASVAILKEPDRLRFVPYAVPIGQPLSGDAIVIARGTVRAGRSRAPPAIA